MHIRSINKNYEELLILLQEIDYSPEIIELTETREVLNLNMFNIENYESYHIGKGVTQNDGVIIYVKNEIYHTATIQKIGNSKVLSINITTNENEIKLCAIYRSPKINTELFIENIDS